MPGGGRFGDWGKGPAFEGEPWIVHYTMYPPTADITVASPEIQTGRIRMWCNSTEIAIERAKAVAARRGWTITIWNVYRPGRTPGGLHVPEGMEEIPE